MNSSVKNLSDCATLFQGFGYQFFSVKSLVLDQPRKYSTLWNTIYFVVGFVFITTLAVVNAILTEEKEIQEKLSAKTALSFIIQHLFQAGLILIFCISSIQSFVSTSLIKNLYLNSFKISRIFDQQLSYSLDHSKIKKKLFVLFFIISGFICIMSIFFGLNDPKFQHLRNIFTSLLLHYLAVSVLKIWFFVELTNYHLENVYFKLENMSVSTKFQQNLSFSIKPVIPKKPRDVTSTVESLRKIYNTILENAEIINSSIGVTMLTIIVVMVIIITASFYRIFLIFDGRFPHQHIGGENQNES